MKLRHTIPATLIALAALAGLAAPASATSLAGTLSGDATLTPTGMPGVYVSNFSGEADDVTFGAFTLSGQSTVDFSHAPSVTIESGMFSETFSNGTVFGTDSGDGTASGKGTATVTIDLLVTGGTGAFAGVKGEITATEMITMTGKTTESITGSYTGSVSAVPLPAALPLFGAAVIGLAAWGRRGAKKPSA